MLDAEFVFYLTYNLLELAWCSVQQDGDNWKESSGVEICKSPNNLYCQWQAFRFPFRSINCFTFIFKCLKYY